MNIEEITQLEKIKRLTEDSIIKAIRWDLKEHDLFIDIDCTEEYRDEHIIVSRAWLIFRNYSFLLINIDWGDFIGGASIMDISLTETPDKEYIIKTDFPQGILKLRSTEVILLKGRPTKVLQGSFWEFSKREIEEESNFFTEYIRKM